MKYDIPYSKIFKLALLTSPLFGILGSVPVFALNRLEIPRVLIGFLGISTVTMLFWIVNILFLKFSESFTFRAKHWIRYGLSIIVCAVLLSIIFQLFVLRYVENNFQGDINVKFPPGGPSRLRFIMPVIQSISINVSVIVLMELILLRDRKQIIETENTILRLSNLEAKHSQLKQQLHPHFLFNSLNILKSLIKKSPEQAEEYLVKLSELLRFTIYSNKQALIKLADELELSISYLNMQKVRFNEALQVTINVKDKLKQNGYVPVYSLQLLIENAIKHNTLTAVRPLHISIFGNEKDNTVTVSNNIQSRPGIEDESGVGLSNLAERYRLLGNKIIDISKESGEFKVTINVLENENSNH
jgi:two-component system, LytTR family, sensor kinase